MRVVEYDRFSTDIPNDAIYKLDGTFGFFQQAASYMRLYYNQGKELIGKIEWSLETTDTIHIDWIIAINGNGKLVLGEFEMFAATKDFKRIRLLSTASPDESKVTVTRRFNFYQSMGYRFDTVEYREPHTVIFYRVKNLN